MTNPTWPASCRMLYSSIAEAMKEANELHQSVNPATTLKYSLLPIGKGNRVFSVACRVAFPRTTTKEELQKNLVGVNVLNDMVAARKVFVDVIRGYDAEVLGRPRNPIEIVFRATAPAAVGGYYETSLVYSDDGGLIDQESSTRSTDLAGHDIVLFLTQGLVKGQEFPNRI